MRVKLLKPGTRFGRLKIVKFSRTINYRAAYICKCDCGNIKEIKAEKLKGGTTTSCGCYSREVHSRLLRKQATTHGLTYTKAYKQSSNNKYRALKAAAKGSHTAEDILSLLRLQDNECFYCFKDLADYHVDHKIPLSRGGSDGKRNLCVSCPTCNLTKRTRTHREFRKIITEQVTE